MCTYGCKTYNPLCDACDESRDNDSPYVSKRKERDTSNNHGWYKDDKPEPDEDNPYRKN